MTAKSTIELIFLGTGCSTGIPDIICLTQGEPCATCLDAEQPNSPNKRLTTSLLIRLADPETGEPRHILIDSTKFLSEAANRWFREYGVGRIDSTILTHAHYDAVGGLDALRSWTNILGYPMPIYVRPEDLAALEKLFFYIVKPRENFTGSAIANLDFVQIDEKPFTAEGLEFLPLRVEHGKNYYANGYKFGDICYISDVSAVSDEVMAEMRGAQLLILDAQQKRRTFGNHLTLESAIDVVREARPAKTLLIGMSHRLEHREINAELAELREAEGLDIQLAHDGLRITQTIAR